MFMHMQQQRVGYIYTTFTQMLNNTKNLLMYN